MKQTYFYRCVALALVSGVGVSSTMAQEANSPLFRGQLQEITIIGNTINEIDNTLPNVDVVNLNVLRNPGVNDLRAALQQNPAVEINSTSNGNATQLRIRGFGANYTEVTLDGQKMPTYYVFGPFTSGGRDFVETETLKQIDIVKGLHSPKQDSGALAGSVNMQTYDPSDLVDADNPLFISVKPGYTSKNRGVSGSLTFAGQHDNMSGLLIYTQRHYHELDNMGNDADQTRQDKQTINQHNLLAKGEMTFDHGSVLLTGEYFKRKQWVTPRYNEAAESYTDPTTRKRLQAEGHFYDLGGLDSADMQVSFGDYRQQTHIISVSDFVQRNINLQFNGSKRIHYANMQHNLLFGAAYDHNKFDYQLSGQYGSVRYLPVIKRNTFSLYLKDQLAFANGLTLSPGVRVLHQRLSSEVDDLYRRNPALGAQGDYIPNNSTTVVTPSINATYAINDNSTVFASYARGARLADESNIGSFDHGFGFILPNPDLKTEKSNNFELGYSYVLPEQFELKVTGFYSKFHDFIDYAVDGVFGVTPWGRPKMVMRPFNVKKAKTYGIEVESSYALSPQLYAHASLAWMRGRIGDEASHGVTLSQAYPAKAILGLNYNQDEVWGADLNWTVAGKGQKPEGENKMRAPGYGVIDVSGWWKPMDNLLVSAGVYNLTDKKYWLSSDVNGLPTLNRKKQPINLDTYTQPGRNFAVNLRYDF